MEDAISRFSFFFKTDDDQACFVDTHFQSYSALPYLHQVNLLIGVRFADPAVEYVPRFIAFSSTKANEKNPKARELFDGLSFRLPDAMTATFSSECRSKNCQDINCGYFVSAHLNLSKVLVRW